MTPYSHYEEAGRHLLAARYLIQRARHVPEGSTEWNRLLTYASQEASIAERLVAKPPVVIVAEVA